jgi:hypothetical protein
MQLFKRESEGTIDPWASAVLVSFQGAYYAISAGHIFDDAPFEKIGPMIKNEWVDLSTCTNLIAYSPPNEKSLEDIDLAVWKINEEGVSVLTERWQFYPLYEKDFEHVNFEKKYHFLFGYPWRKTKVRNFDKQIVSEPFFLTTTLANSNQYVEVGAKTGFHVLLNFSRQTTISIESRQQTISPHPEGMSGCGMWVLPSPYIERVSVDTVKLAGIFTHYFEDRDMMIANRLDYAKALFHANED